jgi:V8-like Glu-specific endopeptidase
MSIIKREHLHDMCCQIIIPNPLPNNPNNVSTGSGLFVYLKNKIIIVSNKHVLLPTHDDKESSGLLANIEFGSDGHKFIGKFKIIEHPNNNIDLAILIVPTELKYEIANYITPITEEMIRESIDQTFNIEEVLMIGYPTFKNYNSTLICRSGITASIPKINIDGLPQGIIDIANIGGSSGSPIFIYKRLGNCNNGNIRITGDEFYILGVVFATNLGNINNIQVPGNIGHYIKVSCILDFNTLI